MVNLERAPSIEDGFRFGGHYVTGHVDDVATVLDLREEGGSWKLIVGLIQSGDRYLFDKGSIAVDGVSLTVNQPSGGQFWAAIVPHTYEHTCISEYRPGRRVNLEYDAVAKYVVETVQRLRR
jgi:riboflavin synthase